MYEALTRWNYFPNQKAPVGELPPSISTRRFTPEIAELVASVEEAQPRRRSGYDHAEYSMTRHDNIPRRLALVHPRPYARLAKAMFSHWNEIGPLVDSENSAIKPDTHFDGRIFIMNYEDAQTKASMAMSAGFSKRFRVETDVASCFNSIYSHSIPWAVVGVEQAKAQARGMADRHWSDEIDALQRAARRNETNGVAIGPATSSIIVELVLGRVDANLRAKGFRFRRYIDDYIAFCATHENAQLFLRELSEELAAFKLHLNLQKTNVAELPEPVSDTWVIALGTALGARITRNSDGVDIVHISDAIQYLDFATRLNKDTRDGSVLKYAVGSLLPYLRDGAVFGIMEYLLSLCWHYPVLLPYLEVVAGRERHLLEPYGAELNAIVIENARNRRSDGMAWPLHLMRVLELEVSQDAVTSVLESGDCVALTLLYKTRQVDGRIIDFGRRIAQQEPYERDQQWLLLYQMYIGGSIDELADRATFDILRAHNVDFVPDGTERTEAELYCGYLDNPFREPEERVLDFAEWMTARNNAGTQL
ncbi:MULTISPECIES: antiviral reverse transcriptase Drt4 [unclassified Paraburkholderia]|uniref:antiviral reverse transcriptase Drt4 n=1 Tax=unclassified Paraburkholderia TaxID=2615204 RepID=UPI001617225B|nr:MULTISPECIES: antiviral reverse transcriptase Drt4 [unclassified Paraburkholderia]MBB5441597.1 hypothetical protein [Paraburkholderia sp. WSM4177]MBB5481992.1 hypothetical protein [Paraburkholderia sp. WSM4180]